MLHIAFGLALLFSQQFNASVKGEVRLDNERPFDRPARVQLFRMGQHVADLYTAPDGSFWIDGIDAGPYLLSVHSPGYSDASVPIDVLGNSGGLDVVINLKSERRIPSGDSSVISIQGYRPIPKAVSRALTRSDGYIREKRYDDAEKLLKAASRKSPLEGDTYFMLAYLYFEQSRWEEAIATGLQAHSRNHRIADVHLLLAKSYGKLGDAAGVVSELKLFLKEAPDSTAKNDARKILHLLSEGR
jgi:tetratricopeptide (TPR) repeat protein